MAKKEKPAKGAKPEAPEADVSDVPEGEEGAAPKKKKMAGKTLVLFIILPLLLIVGGGGTTAFLLLAPKGEAHGEAEAGDHKKEKKDKHAKKKGDHGKEGEAGEGAGVVTEGDGVFYYALPEMLVNITSGDGRPVYLKLKLTLEAKDEEVIAAIEPALPRVLDQYQAFLRELRVDDLAGSAGAYRLRLELLRRVNLAVAPAQVNAVLIEEMLVQ